ncbi:TPA: SEL1-like repeat protein [Stenotrophomonas maltophilia]|nr:SEL1-like repeat protein [Stenotrophomonas maltophilia]
MRPTVSPALLGPLLLLLAAPAAYGAGCAPDRGASLRPALMTQGFLQAHPDLHWRELGLQSWRQGRPDHALLRFKRAAAHADKVSQSLVARMYQEGVGTGADPVLAYIWMDLAAERGYRDLLLERERYWNRLDATQQQRVLAEGPALYATYGDATAKPRMEAAMRVERSRMTGSRTGWVSSMLHVELSDGPEAGWPTRGDDYYRDAYWNPAAYWCMQDQIWQQEHRGRRVEVGPLGPVEDPQP